MIIDHNDPEYARLWRYSGANRWNGAYYYSQEIVANIIPNVATDRNWVTVHVEGRCLDHSIVFIHNNLNPHLYDWMAAYYDLVLVCGTPDTTMRMRRLGRTVYLPLSVDVGYVRSFMRIKTKGTAYAGRPSKRCGEGAVFNVPAGVSLLENMPRRRFLASMAEYERVYAVGRCAIEAKVLGCEVLPYDPRYPDPSVWRVVDNIEAAAMLQVALDGIDGRIR